MEKRTMEPAQSGAYFGQRPSRSQVTAATVAEQSDKARIGDRGAADVRRSVSPSSSYRAIRVSDPDDLRHCRPTRRNSLAKLCSGRSPCGLVRIRVYGRPRRLGGQSSSLPEFEDLSIRDMSSASDGTEKRLPLPSVAW